MNWQGARPMPAARLCPRLPLESASSDMETSLHDSASDISGIPAFAPESVGGDLGTVAAHRSPASSLVSRLVEEMIAAWKRGDPVRAEAYLDQVHELGAESALRLIYEEVCLRREAGHSFVTAEVVNRFPQWRAQLELLLDCQRIVHGEQPGRGFPRVGELLGEFRLVAELGRGASGPIFLALQNSLALRPVVLKVTTCSQEEHLALARLQHMNIVPLYSEQVIPGRNQRALCMPYLGGATLDRLFGLLRDCPPSRRSGKELIDALDLAQASVPLRISHQGPFRATLARSPYAAAIAWIGACLADGLQYAHDRGLVHMDIKPSNVLLTADGQPMLLDFHLSRGPIDAGGPLPRRLGGTTAYASPEQKAAMASIREGGPIPTPVDGRSDIYSLGAFLYEALGGTIPGRGTAGATLPLDRLNPEVSTGLSDIIHKCLNADPGGRYARASAVASDLRRHLNHLPLVGVPNRSLFERWQKWRRRRPTALVQQGLLVLTIGAAITAATILVSAYRHRLDELKIAIETSRIYVASRQFGPAEDVLKRALALAGSTPAFESSRRMCVLELRVVLRDRKAAELHELADLVRFRSGLSALPSDDARSLVERGRAIWAAHSLLLSPIPGRSEPEIEQTIRTDLLDIITVWADLNVRLAAASENKGAIRESLAQLDQAAGVLGSGPALERLRVVYQEALGSAVGSPRTMAVPLEPKTAWEHCDLGRAYLRDGEFAAAAAQFQAAVDLHPRDFWSNFFQGLCAHKLGRFDEAVSAFRVCISLAENPAECYFNRALAYEALGRTEDALLDYTRALRCDDRLTGAALNRGILYYNAWRYADAAVDLSRALAMNPPRDLRGVILFNRALVALARNDRRAAVLDLNAAMGSGHARASELLEQLRAASPGEK
jgi:eukaryotic-like serine/threonine-protein kinase